MSAHLSIWTLAYCIWLFSSPSAAERRHHTPFRGRTSIYWVSKMMTEQSSDDPNNEAAMHSMKLDIVRQIFGDVVTGQHLKDYSCAIESTILIHGRLYVTTKCLYFYSNIFGIEKKLRIPFQHISSVSKAATALLIPNSIIVHTDKGDYTFRSFWTRDKCFNTINEALNKFKSTPSLQSSALPH